MGADFYRIFKFFAFYEEEMIVGSYSISREYLKYLNNYCTDV